MSDLLIKNMELSKLPKNWQKKMKPTKRFGSYRPPENSERLVSETIDGVKTELILPKSGS